MQYITTEQELREAILQLERRQAEEGKILKEQFLTTYASFQPANILRSLFRGGNPSKDTGPEVLSTLVGLIAGNLSRTFVEGVTKRPFKAIVGNAVMLGITNAVARNPEVVASAGRGLFRLFSKKAGSHRT